MIKEDDYYWSIIEKLEWSIDHDSDRIKKYILDNYTREEANNLAEFGYEKSGELMDRFESDWLGDPGIQVSDDGWSDLTNEVVGRGKEFYNNITVEKLQRMAISGDYYENFSYSFQYDY